MSVLDLARPEIRALQAYASARMESATGNLLLNANESPWAPPGDAGLACHRYPEPQPLALLEALGLLYGVESNRLLIGRGSDEPIDLLLRAFCRAGQDAILIQTPVFGMYAVSARIQGAAVLEVPLAESFVLDTGAVLNALTPAVKLVFVCRPNNPTGQDVALADIVVLLRALNGRALVVVDEAYTEFADHGSAVSLLDHYDNLVVLRTLSKAWGLAGARIGCLLADARIVTLLRKIMSPYPLPRPCVELVLMALSEEEKTRTRQHIADLREQRELMRDVLVMLPGVRTVLPSQTNFLSVRFDDADVALSRLSMAGIVVRDVRHYARLGDTLRITIGTAAENARVLAALEGHRSFAQVCERSTDA